MKGNVSVFCQDVIGFDDEHEKKKHCLPSAARSGKCLWPITRYYGLYFLLLEMLMFTIYSWYWAELLKREFILSSYTHFITFKVRALRLIPHWWEPQAPRGSGSRSQRHPRWRSLRCCRQNPPSSRTRRSRQPEINLGIGIVLDTSLFILLTFCPALQHPMPVLVSGSGQQDSPRSQHVFWSGHKTWLSTGQSP